MLEIEYSPVNSHQSLSGSNFIILCNVLVSVETLSEPQETQDESVNTIQETPNSQFRLFLSVMPCMPRIDGEKSAICSPSPPLFSPPTVTRRSQGSNRGSFLYVDLPGSQSVSQGTDTGFKCRYHLCGAALLMRTVGRRGFKNFNFTDLARCFARVSTKK